MPDDGKQVFISYALDDRDFARRLGSLMEQRGASVFLDADVRPGDLWADVLRREIERATALVLIIPSRNVANRNTVWFEAGAAKALGKPILAVLPPHHKVDRGELPTDLADLLVLNADQRPLENIADMLLQAVPEKSTEAAAT
jgi:hypothetical protein